MSEQPGKNGGNDTSHENKEGGKPDHPVVSSTPENALGELNPSAPGNTGTTPHTNAQVG